MKVITFISVAAYLSSCSALICEVTTPCTRCIEGGCAFYMNGTGFMCGDPNGFNDSNVLRIRRAESCGRILKPLSEPTDILLSNKGEIASREKVHEIAKPKKDNVSDFSPTASKQVSQTEAFLEAHPEATTTKGMDFHFAEAVCRQYAYVHAKLHPKKPAQKHAAAFRKCLNKFRTLNKYI